MFIFLNISRGSLNEVETQIIIAEQLGFIRTEELNPVLQKADEISRMLNNLIRSLKRHPRQ